MSAVRLILANRCPRCQKGTVFSDTSLMSLRIGKMNERCPCCQMDFAQEPGFYWGAMYVSYALSLVQVFTTAAVLLALSMPFEFKSLAILVGVLLLFSPLNYRVSRLTWLFLFAKA